MARPEVRKRRLGSLEAFVIEGDPKACTIIALHGYGADMTDLASLAGTIQVPKGTSWVFPNGHLRIPMGPHYEGRGWFPISLAQIESSQGSDLCRIVPPGLKRARENVLELIEALKVEPGRLLLGGFSQGGMVAVETALHLSEPPRGLAILSSALVNADAWAERAKILSQKSPGFEYFVAHGRRDTVLPFQYAERLDALLRECGWKGRLQAFDGGHEIPPEVLIQLGTYMRQHC